MFAEVNVCNCLPILGRLVLGCFDADFCKQICVSEQLSINMIFAYFSPLQTHFSKNTQKHPKTSKNICSKNRRLFLVKFLLLCIVSSLSALLPLYRKYLCLTQLTIRSQIRNASHNCNPFSNLKRILRGRGYDSSSEAKQLDL